MNETIGTKGGSNDRKRTIIITKNRKKKLKKQSENIEIKKIKELEKRVRKSQIINFFAAVPLIISSEVLKTIISNCKVINKNQVKEENNMININSSTIVDKEVNEKFDDNLNYDSINKLSVHDKLPIIITPIEEKVYLNDKDITKEKEESINNDKTIKIEETINKDIDKKIIETYIDELKTVRTELKKVAYDYSNKDNVSKTEAEDLLDKLNLVIKKLDIFNNMIIKSKLGDEEYYYYLALKYIEEFNNHNIVENVKNSDLYIEIADKLKTIDYMKEELRKQVIQKQIGNDILIENADIEDTFYEEFNADIEDFQNAQEEIIEELNVFIPEDEKADYDSEKDKRENNKSNDDEIVEDNKNIIIDEASIALSKAKALNKYCAKLISIIDKPSMKLPSVRSTKAVAITTLIAVYFMKKVLKNNYRIKRRKKIMIKDFDKSIENDLENIEKVSTLIKQASSEINDIINEIITKYSNYLHLKEFQKLLNNLENIKNDILEKEYEIDNIKKSNQAINNQNIKK